MDVRYCVGSKARPRMMSRGKGMLGPIENENSNLAAAVPESGKGSAPRRRSRRKWRRIVLSLLVVVLLVAVGVLGGVGWIGSERAIHQGPKSYPWHLADFPELRPERVTLPSTT